MRLLALTTLCVMVSILSGLALFWTVSTESNELWLEAMFVLAALLSLVFALALIKKAASRSIDGSMTYHQWFENSQLDDSRYDQNDRS